MFGRKESTRWLWESPVPSMFDQPVITYDNRLSAAIIAYRTLDIGGYILAGVGAVLFAKFRIAPQEYWLAILISLLGWFWALSALEDFIANNRRPSDSLFTALQMVASMSPELAGTIIRFQQSDALTFTLAREIVSDNQHLLTKYNYTMASAAIGPRAICPETGGASLHLSYFGGQLEFNPGEDGWYRASVNDEKLHRMLSANAVGPDAGTYWLISDVRGVWGVPASFIDQLQSRLDGLSKVMPSQPDS